MVIYLTNAYQVKEWHIPTIHSVTTLHSVHTNTFSTRYYIQYKQYIQYTKMHSVYNNTFSIEQYVLYTIIHSILNNTFSTQQNIHYTPIHSGHNNNQNFQSFYCPSSITIADHETVSIQIPILSKRTLFRPMVPPIYYWISIQLLICQFSNHELGKKFHKG